MPTAANPNSASDNASTGEDVSLIKSRLGTVAQIQPPLIEQSWFMGLQGVPVLAWLALLIRRKQAERLANNPRLRREQGSGAKAVRRGLQELREAAKANAAEKFFAAVVRLLQERLGERLDLPASAITEAVLERAAAAKAGAGGTTGGIGGNYFNCATRRVTDGRRPMRNWCRSFRKWKRP